MSAPEPGLIRSPLSDGRWHRPHPLTPLLRGGFVLIAVIGIIVANLRERLLSFVLPIVDPQLRGSAEHLDQQPGDPVDWVVANNLSLLAAVSVLIVLVVVVVGFTLSWRFHTFRITGTLVEVRRGILFRSHRRAPLDRVQGVNLTRPLLARLIGLATLEVLGAGTDGDVKLEYLRTADAETVRADILRLASGRRLAEESAQRARPGGARSMAGAVVRGVADLVDGERSGEPVLTVPAARLVAAHLLRASTFALLLLVVVIVVASIERPFVLFIAAPIVLGMIAYEARRLARALRYGIAATPDGVRIAFGLLTTVTETIPPGRIHAVEIAQPILWRPAGWWEIRINRAGRHHRNESVGDRFTTVLPVGTAVNVDQVLALVVPQLPAPARERALAAAAGTVDGFERTPRRAWLLHPLSWRRTGVLLADDVLMMRRGFVRRRLVIVPLARMQGVTVVQGPFARNRRVAGVRAYTVSGPVNTRSGALDRDVALRIWADAAASSVVAAGADRSDRWASGDRLTGEDGAAADAAAEEEP